MCGIVGIARFGELGTHDLRTSALYLATTLLEATESRGKDATGVAALFDDGNFFGQKMGVSASEFVARFGGKNDDFDGLLSVLRTYQSGLRVFIGHCRKKSAGSLQNVDNHPIKTGNIIGIHNGTLKNHNEIFKNLDCSRDGEVDSEAIFRLLQHFTKNCKEPFTLDIAEEVCRRLEGSFSILAFNAHNPNQLISARDGRPAEYCLIKPLKLIMIASEKKFLEQTIWSYNKLSWLHAIDKFSKLKSSDVEFKTLPDDTVALFDLTQAITATTKIEDLFTTKAIPKATDRIWKSEYKTTTYGAHTPSYNSYGNRRAANKFSDEKEKEDKNLTLDSTTTTKNTSEKVASKKEAIGSVWCKSLNTYVKAFGSINEIANGLVLDIEKKTNMSVDDAEKETVLDNITVIDEANSLLESTELQKKTDSVENYKAGISTAIVSITTENSNILNEIKDGAKEGKKSSNNELEARRAAIEAAKNISKFDNVFEVAEVCGTDVESLKQLPIPALANRILKAYFSELFINGWLSKCTTISKNIMIKTSNTTALKAQKHIRVLKSLNNYFDKIISNVPDNLTTVSTHTKNNYKTVLSSEVTVDTLNSIFNAGDFRANKALKNIMTSLQKIGD